jgi:RNA polymerase sigma factor for flagellar operon FliA
MSADEREALIRALLPLVRSIARRVHRMVPMSDLDDLIGDGCVGAIRAVDAFDPARGVPLDQYARRVILGAVLNGVRRMDPVSERMRRTMRGAQTARYALAQEIGTMPTMNAMSRLSPGLTAARTEAHRRTPLSLDSTLPLGERLDLDHSADPQTIVSERVERQIVRGAVAKLPSRQMRIVVAHYFAERRLRELVAPMRISPQRVSQLHLLALRRLRAALAVRP